MIAWISMAVGLWLYGLGIYVTTATSSWTGIILWTGGFLTMFITVILEGKRRKLI